MTEFITSQANPRVKAIRKLHERKERQQSGLFYVEGLRLVGEAVQLNADIQFLVVAPYLLVSPFAKELLAAAPARDLPRLEVSQVVLRLLRSKKAAGDWRRGAPALAALEEVSLAPGSLWVALDAVADPGNLGTILRTCDAVGAQGVILLDNATDPYDPTAVRASMGAIFSQKLVKTTTVEFSEWKKAQGCRVVGTSGASSLDYQQYHYPDPCILLMGSERQGLQSEQLAACDQLVSIPMTGRSDSLNLAVATAVVLYEIFNQRREKSMIASLSGEISEVTTTSLVVKIGGIGLRVFVPNPLRSQVKTGDKIDLHTYLVVREDSLSLYGFEPAKNATSLCCCWG